MKQVGSDPATVIDLCPVVAVALAEDLSHGVDIQAVPQSINLPVFGSRAGADVHIVHGVIPDHSCLSAYDVLKGCIIDLVHHFHHCFILLLFLSSLRGVFCFDESTIAGHLSQKAHTDYVSA